jgi:hypothetical protein
MVKVVPRAHQLVAYMCATHACKASRMLTQFSCLNKCRILQHAHALLISIPRLDLHIISCTLSSYAEVQQS